MAIDPSLSETCLKNSIKKFFVDNIFTAESIDIDFDVQYVLPKLADIKVDKWISVKFGSINGGTLSKSHVILHLFTRKDTEGIDLSAMRDIIVGKLFDETATDGVVRIPFYDLLWNQVGGIMTRISSEAEEPMVLEDDTKYKWIRVELSWGAK
jgi:hypothetical protein